MEPEEHCYHDEKSYLNKGTNCHYYEIDSDPLFFVDNRDDLPHKQGNLASQRVD